MSPKIYKRMRKILLSEWDPLHVGDNPNLADEYDRYIPALVSLLRSNPSRAEIRAALRKIETDELKLETPSRGLDKACSAIWKIRSLAANMRLVDT